MGARDVDSDPHPCTESILPTPTLLVFTGGKLCPLFICRLKYIYSMYKKENQLKNPLSQVWQQMPEVTAPRRLGSVKNGSRPPASILSLYSSLAPSRLSLESY